MHYPYMGLPLPSIGTESKSDALEAMPTMGGLPSIYWPFIAIGIWHFVTAAGGNQFGCHLTFDTLKKKTISDVESGTMI